jgi:hypothetical protein
MRNAQGSTNRTTSRAHPGGAGSSEEAVVVFRGLHRHETRAFTNASQALMAAEVAACFAAAILRNASERTI